MKTKYLLKIIILSIIGILFLQTHLYAINYYDLLCDKLKNVDNNNKMNKMYEYLNSLTPEQQLLLTRQMVDAHIKNNKWGGAAAGIQLVLYKYPKTIPNLQLIVNDIKNQSLNEIYRTRLIWLISTQEFSQSLNMDLLNQLNEYIINEIQNDKLSTDLRKQYIFELGGLLFNYNIYSKYKIQSVLNKLTDQTANILLDLKNSPKTSNIIKYQIYLTLIDWMKLNQILKSQSVIHSILKTDFINETKDDDYKSNLAKRLFVNFDDYATVELELPNFKDAKIRERIVSDMRFHKRMQVEEAERLKKLREAHGKK